MKHIIIICLIFFFVLQETFFAMQPVPSTGNDEMQCNQDLYQLSLILTKLPDNNNIYQVPRNLLMTSSILNLILSNDIMSFPKIEQIYINVPTNEFFLWFTWYSLLNYQSPSDAQNLIKVLNPSQRTSLYNVANLLKIRALIAAINHANRKDQMKVAKIQNAMHSCIQWLQVRAKPSQDSVPTDRPLHLNVTPVSHPPDLPPFEPQTMPQQNPPSFVPLTATYVSFSLK